MRALPATLLVAVSTVSWPAMANAQAAGTAQTAQENPGRSETGQIEEIVVTAQRRTESAQSVPISLQSFSSSSLKQSAVTTTEDLTTVVGGLIVQPTAARPSLFLRGVGTNSTNTTPAVLTFIDGVYQPFGQSADLANIASIEVLKGPQGTLFGRNATGGVLQITTRPPSETLGARAEIGYGAYQTVDTSAYVTGGLAPGVAMDVALRYSNQDKGWGSNVYNGDDVYVTHKYSVRSRLRAALSDVTSITLVGDYRKINGTIGAAVTPAVGYGFLFVDGAIRRRGDFYPGRFDINAGPITPFARTHEWGAALTLETQFSGITARSISSYRRSSEEAFIDSDGGPSSMVNLHIKRSPRTAFTQELQLVSGSGGRFTWTAGLFYFDSKAVVSPFEINNRQAFDTDFDKSIAAYAQGTYEILPKTHLTLGTRYTIEKRTIKGYAAVSGIETPGTRGSLSQKFKEPTWRVALDHQFTRDAMVYASASRGFNAGLFNQSSLAGFANTIQNPAVKPEFLTAYEIGAKTDLFDRHLRLNLSAFQYDYKGLQQQIYSGSATITINAGDARIRGVDFEVTARPIKSLTLSLSGTYLDTKYTKYESAPNYTLQAAGDVIAGIRDANGVVTNQAAVATGNMVANTPRWSYTAGISHVIETDIGDFTTSADVNYRGKMYADAVNHFKVPTRYVANATERWTSAEKRFFASLWIKNLFDKRYDYTITVLAPYGLVGLAAPPRTYGGTFGFEF